MPYGIPKSKGGESLTNVSKMESCVRQVMQKQKGIDKSRAIAICKSSMGFTKGK
jgi:hypothetical protein